MSGAGENVCPCGSGLVLEACCGPVLETASAATAEALMRSRYSAYALGAIDHLLATTSRRQRQHHDRDSALEWSSAAEWLGLEVVAVAGGGAAEDTGSVEFRARYRIGGRDAVHHETAEFRRENGQWRYDGGRVASEVATVVRERKIGRNEPCPCGSGRKYKKCCGG